jgi:ATP-dependent DNA helicase HFM1/MER3
VQISLTALELPADKEANSIKRHIITEKNIIFDRMRRLVRCVVDCKVYDSDGEGAKTALELTRALAANSWENHPAQLQQINGLGPVTMRKLTAHGITNIVDLARHSFVDIERIVGRNPPYGKNLLKPLQGFPQLTMTVNATNNNGKPYSMSEGTVFVPVKITLGYGNTKLPIWNDRIPIVTFLAHTTGGRLAYFWRGSIKKLHDAESFQLRFSVGLRDAAENVACYFNCEDIVGTEVMEIFSPGLTASIFQNLNQRQVLVASDCGTTKKTTAEVDEDVADDDMLSVLAETYVDQSSSLIREPQMGSQADDFDVEFLDIDEVLAHGSEKESQEGTLIAPIQMENGKWMCNHHCTGGAPTKNGRPCTHKCCHEGLDKPRPPPRKKNAHHVAEQEQLGQPTLEGSKLSARTSQSGDRPTRQPKSVSLTSSNANLRESQSNHNLLVSQSTKATPTCNGMKRPLLDSTNWGADEHLKKKKKRESPITDNIDLDCIDLCGITDNEAQAQTATPKLMLAQSGAKHESIDPHNQVKYKEIASCRPTKPFRKTSLSKSDPTPLEKLTYEPETDYSSDMFEDETELFPQLSDFLRLAEGPQPLRTPREELNDNNSVSPQIFESFNGNKNLGFDPTIGFSDVGEIEETFDWYIDSLKINNTLPNQESEYLVGPGTPDQISTINTVQKVDRTPQSKPTLYTNIPSSTMKEPEEAMKPLFFQSNPSDNAFPFRSTVSPLPNPLAIPLPGEPAWIGQYDQELIDMLRGSVEFVD